MSLDPGNQFNEAGTSAADFDPQNQVLANSPVLSADVNVIAERVYRRTKYLYDRRLVRTYEASGDDGDATPGYFATFNTGSYTDGVALNVPGAMTGDVIVVRATLLCVGDFQNVARLRLQYIADFGGGSPSAQTNVSGAAMSISQPATSTTWIQVPLQGRISVDRDGVVRVIVVGKTFLDNLNVQTYTLIAERHQP